MSRSRRARVWILVGIGFTVSLLLWAKLRLIGDIPRSVYADPKAQGSPEGEPR